MNRKSKTNWDRLDAATDEDITKGIAADPDAAPELTDEDFKRARPASEVLPQVVDAYRRSRGRQKAPTKVAVSIRLSPDVVEYFKAQGQGWQTRINEVLEEYIVSRQ